MNEQKTAIFRKIQSDGAEPEQSREQLLVTKYLSGLQLKRKLWGVDEEAVWKALERLTLLYEDALTVERSRRELAQRKLEALQLRKEESHGQ